jgi:haloalkane dehalogenase
MNMEPISAEFPFESRFVEVHDSRMHYIDVGEGDPVLFLHGNPTSSYLWRNVIPHLASGTRCIAPDLIGMGRSDKPDLDYRFVDHAWYLDGFIDALQLENITYVVHDWGGALGLYHARRHESRVRAVALMETIVRPYETWDEWPEAARQIFQGFRDPDVGWEMVVDRNLFVERVLPGSILRQLSDEEMDRYREPFTDPASRKPVWRWPNEIPIGGQPEDVTAIVEESSRWFAGSDLPKLLITAEPGAIVTPAIVEWCTENLRQLTTVNVGAASHFLQEDQPEAIGQAIARWYESDV